MITQQEFETILFDETKRINEDIAWTLDPVHTPALLFRVLVRSEPDWPLSIFGWWNPRTEKLNFSLLLKGTGRIYALNMGTPHRNPDGRQVGEVHKHRWSDGLRDKQAYEPDDITEPWDRPVAVWKQFCAEAGIIHIGTLTEPAKQGQFAI